MDAAGRPRFHASEQLNRLDLLIAHHGVFGSDRKAGSVPPGEICLLNAGSSRLRRRTLGKNDSLDIRDIAGEVAEASMRRM